MCLRQGSKYYFFMLQTKETMGGDDSVIRLLKIAIFVSDKIDELLLWRRNEMISWTAGIIGGGARISESLMS